MIDLPGKHDVYVVGKWNGNEFRGQRPRDIKKRLVSIDKGRREAEVVVLRGEMGVEDEDQDRDGQPIKHYDAAGQFHSVLSCVMLTCPSCN